MKRLLKERERKWSFSIFIAHPTKLDLVAVERESANKKHKEREECVYRDRESGEVMMLKALWFSLAG